MMPFLILAIVILLLIIGAVLHSAIVENIELGKEIEGQRKRLSLLGEALEEQRRRILSIRDNLHSLRDDNGRCK